MEKGRGLRGGVGRGWLLKVLTTLEEMGARKAGGQVRRPATDRQTDRLLHLPRPQMAGEQKGVGGSQTCPLQPGESNLLLSFMMTCRG